jgi:hypothetical protein
MAGLYPLLDVVILLLDHQRRLPPRRRGWRASDFIAAHDRVRLVGDVGYA